ncbi:GFA family protein [Novosphingobium sp. FKTRR1]|uniref:GFA family protein n=1 Tax=Novosphingobium sp. FKTRR1 TaxID=2879118 RepID=UPI001CEFE6F6|nr:GFA family protein [Novosphingobium sp. FKTRR1]
MRAQCQCGQLSAEVQVATDQIVACHCQACQRRTGAPFGLIAYYATADVTIAGQSVAYTRTADSGRTFTGHFCATCGTTLWFDADLKPDVIGIAVGAFADPTHPAPARSVWEDTMHEWVAIPGPIPHFPKGRS